jgi:hypothetical protein
MDGFITIKNDVAVLTSKLLADELLSILKCGLYHCQRRQCLTASIQYWRLTVDGWPLGVAGRLRESQSRRRGKAAESAPARQRTPKMTSGIEEVYKIASLRNNDVVNRWCPSKNVRNNIIMGINWRKLKFPQQ